jgi:lysine-N-methylase
MSLPILRTPIEERWDCHGCGDCCHGTKVELSADDLRRLREQRWDRHPDYQGVRITRRNGLFSRERVLAHRADHSCVFLSAEGRCRIHEEFGAAAKPDTCRLFPLLLVPTEDGTLLTVRRNCPSAGAGLGRPLDEHTPLLRELSEGKALVEPLAKPPRIASDLRLDWPETRRLLDGLERLMTDPEEPLAVRFARSLELCSRVEAAAPDLSVIDEAMSAATSEPPEPTPPDLQTAQTLRQIGLEYLLFVPSTRYRGAIRERLLLLRAAVAFHRGRGPIPQIFPDQPHVRFEELERPLDPLASEILQPLEEYFVSAVVTRQYTLPAKSDWPIVESFRRLALAFAVALWMLRVVEADRTASTERTLSVISAIGWRHDTDAFAGSYHQSRVRELAHEGRLDRLVAWNAR